MILEQRVSCHFTNNWTSTSAKSALSSKSSNSLLSVCILFFTRKYLHLYFKILVLPTYLFAKKIIYIIELNTFYCIKKCTKELVTTSCNLQNLSQYKLFSTCNSWKFSIKWIIYNIYKTLANKREKPGLTSSDGLLTQKTSDWIKLVTLKTLRWRAK